MNIHECTCVLYESSTLSPPCPIHQPEKAYWRMRILREFGAGTSTTTNTAEIQTHEPYRAPDTPVHFNTTPIGDDVHPGSLVCDADPWEDGVQWARVKSWVTCEACKRVLDVA